MCEMRALFHPNNKNKGTQPKIIEDARQRQTNAAPEPRWAL